MSKKSFKERREELRRIEEFYNKYKDDLRVNQGYLRYKIHIKKMEVNPLYRAKWFFKSTVYACVDLCKYLITEKLFKTRNGRRS